MSDFKLVRAWRNDDGTVVVEVSGRKRIHEYHLDRDEALRLHGELSAAIGHDCAKTILAALRADKRRNMEGDDNGKG